ncbi:glycosyltransferase family protein [Microvirga massiliensis]|uniref:glycosyltransferase family protein n=1 Tax=Microvirga massiliensis TaxID=1033741 RepID=UPI00062BE41D|nr:glycosyltransferase [Microvirga massiliensis]
MHLVALSNERLDPWVNWTTLGPPLLCPLAAKSGGAIVAPPPLRWETRHEWRQSIRSTREADTLFWMQGSARPEWPLMALSASRGVARRAAFVVDAWRPALSKIGVLAVAQRLDPCFVAFREGCEELRRRFPGGRFEWLPFGIDTDVFRPGPGERDIFAFWMGRRHEPLHQALLAYCRERGLVYRYARYAGEFSTEELGAMARRCRYFVVTPPDLDNPERTGGFSPLVMRYLEGLASGARLLGVLPKSGEYEHILPREAILEIRADGSNLAKRLDEDAENSAGWNAVAAACDLVQREHSWSRRAEQIRDRLLTDDPVQIAAFRQRGEHWADGTILQRA